MSKEQYILQLQQLMENANDESENTHKETTISDYSEFIDSALGYESDITEAHVFITHFSPNDVNDFINLLKKQPVNNTRFKEHLKDGILYWCSDHNGACPYEPFLWALKLTDNYVGSIQNNANPQPWKVNAVGEALLSVWVQDSVYMDVLRNVLETWDWYQPVHVMLNLYQRLTSVNDPQLDKRIREHWLYRALYSNSAFNCLCEKKKTKENIQAILQFVSQDVQKDKNMAEIQITNRMRNSVRDYVLNSSKEEYAIAKTYFNDSLHNCSRRARLFFEELFYSDDDHTDEEIKDFLHTWDEQTSDDELRIMKHKLSKTLDENADKVIANAALTKNQLLINEVIKLVDNQDFGFNTQFKLREMLKSVNICSEYADYITRKHEENKSQYSDDKSFIYGCAYCQLGHLEVMPKLFDAHYLSKIGVHNGRYIFADIRLKFPNQFNEQIERLTASCLTDINAAVSLVSSCASIYNERNSSTYPVAFDKVCNYLLSEALRENNSSARYANLLMDLYERIAVLSNRNRYRDQLEKLAGTKSPALQPARNRAIKKIRELYRAI